MSHLIKPLAFRVGKTRTWQYNKLLGIKSSNSFVLNSSLNQLSKNLLKRKRLYFIKGTISDYKNKKLFYKLLYSPKIKTKTPREHSSGAFFRRAAFKPYNWASEIEHAKFYVYRRYEKIAKMPRRRNFIINKWLSKRMFRGAAKINFKKQKNCLQRFSAFAASVRQVAKNRVLFSSQTLKKLHRRLKFGLIKKRTRKKIKFTKKKIRKKFKFTNRNAKFVPILSSQKFIKKLHRKYKSGFNRYKRWTFDKLKARRFNNKLFSTRLEGVVNYSVKAKALNIFSYLVSKNMLTYKTHQRHILNYRYRKFRFRYANYYDIINSFFILSLIKNSENFLFSILKMTLPVLTKIRPFLKFLNIVIKNMIELENKYKVFRINIAGKLAGGTKRTKFQSIGYGVLPIQTLALDASNNFLSFTHLYGEFGVKILMCRNHNKFTNAHRWK